MTNDGKCIKGEGATSISQGTNLISSERNKQWKWSQDFTKQTKILQCVSFDFRSEICDGTELPSLK